MPLPRLVEVVRCSKAGHLGLLLLLADPSLAFAAPRPASVTIAGGVSLGAYEGGLAYYAVELLDANRGLTELKLATGASAGSVNSLLALLQSCTVDVSDPRQSLFWRAWTPVGFSDLRKPRSGPTAVFSREALAQPLALISAAWSAGLRADCDVVYGLSVTRLNPRMTSLQGERLRVPRVEEHFVLRIQGRGPGEPPRLTNYTDPTWEGERTLLPERKDGEVEFQSLADALFASTAFPGAFPPQSVRHCVVRAKDGNWPGCPEGSAETALFVDGGVFDNTPVRLATQLAAAGLEAAGGPARWIDRPEFEKRNVPDAMLFSYVSTEIRTFPGPDETAAGQESRSILDVAGRVGEAFIDSARAKNLLYLHDEDPVFFGRLNLVERHLPAASSPMAAFFGFFERSLREFDFTLGMYDARRMGEKRIAARLGAGAVLRRPETLPRAAAAVEAWQPYLCLSAVLDDPAAAEEACRGAHLQDFRIVLQTSLERLWDRCSRGGVLGTAFADDPRCLAAASGEPPLQVPGVLPLSGESWRRAKGESEGAYTLRLLAAHRFEFKDLGLSRDQAEEAPVAIRELLLALGRDLGLTQPGREAGLVETAVKVAAGQLVYVPPRRTLWVALGRDLELGISKGFTVDRRHVGPVRLHAASQVNNLQQVFSSEHAAFAVSLLGGVEVLPAALATSTLQPSLIVRGGVLLSARDDFGFGSCPDHTSAKVGSCSRPVLGVGVAASVLERVRLQLLFNYYFPTRSGAQSWWTLAPGLGLQWPF